VVARLDDFQRLVVTGRDKSAAGLALVKELFLGHLVRLGVVRDENDLDVLIARAKKLIEKEEETARQIFLHRIHGAGSVHDAEHDRVGFVARVGDRVMVA